MEGCWHDLIPLPVPQLIILQYWLFAQQSYKHTQDRQLKFQLIYWNLGGGTECFAASDILSILWVKCCLGNSKQSRLPGVVWGERHCEEALELQFSVRIALNKKRPTGKEEEKMLAICGEKIRSTSDCCRRQLLKCYPWSSFALCVSVFKFFVSVCLFRILTMFSLVKKLKKKVKINNWRSQRCFSSIFS